MQHFHKRIGRKRQRATNRSVSDDDDDDKDNNHIYYTEARRRALVAIMMRRAAVPILLATAALLVSPAAAATRATRMTSSTVAAARRRRDKTNEKYGQRRLSNNNVKQAKRKKKDEAEAAATVDGEVLDMEEIRRRAAKGARSWVGCQNMTCDEMQEAWIFPSEMPPCPGHVHKYSYEDDSCAAWKGKGGKGKGGGKGGGGRGKGSGSGNSGTGSNGGGNNSGGGSAGGNNGNGGGGGGNSGGGSSGGDGGGSSNGGEGGQGEDEEGGNRVDGGGGNGGGGSGSGSGGGGSGFDINVCESYSDYWLWDLALTCVSTETLEECDCKTAEDMFISGDLMCPDDGGDPCPADCPVCWTCLTLLGCSLGQPNPATDVESIVPYAIAIVVAAAFVSLLIFREKMRQGKQIGSAGGGGKDPTQLGEFPTPYVAAPIYGEAGPFIDGQGRQQQNNVWLAPLP